MEKINQCCIENDEILAEEEDNIPACMTKVVQITKVLLERTMHGLNR